jgi:hypothetical protein
MLTAEQTIAIGRKYGAHRYRFVVEHDQHDFPKVNSPVGSVKIFFSSTRSVQGSRRSRLLLGHGKFTQHLRKPGLVHSARPDRDHCLIEAIVLLDEAEAVQSEEHVRGGKRRAIVSLEARNPSRSRGRIRMDVTNQTYRSSPRSQSP